MRAMLLTLGAAAEGCGQYSHIFADPEGGKVAYMGTIMEAGAPSSILVTEAFLIENSKIRRVEMVGKSTPYHTNSPWPGNLSGN